MSNKIIYNGVEYNNPIVNDTGVGEFVSNNGQKQTRENNERFNDYSDNISAVVPEGNHITGGEYNSVFGKENNMVFNTAAHEEDYANMVGGYQNTITAEANSAYQANLAYGSMSISGTGSKCGNIFSGNITVNGNSDIYQSILTGYGTFTDLQDCDQCIIGGTGTFKNRLYNSIILGANLRVCCEDGVTYSATDGVHFSLLTGSGNKIKCMRGSVVAGTSNNIASYLEDSIVAGNSNTFNSGTFYCAVIGSNNTINSNSSGSAVFGYGNTVSGSYHIIGGYNNKVLNSYNLVTGYGNEVVDTSPGVGGNALIGYYNRTDGSTGAIATGFGTQAFGIGAHTEGYSHGGTHSLTDGIACYKAIGYRPTVESWVTNFDNYCIAHGITTQYEKNELLDDLKFLSGELPLEHSSAYAWRVKDNYSGSAIGNSAHVEGEYCGAKGYGVHAEGQWTTCIGSAGHTEGFYTTGGGEGTHVEGKYNVIASPSGPYGTRMIDNVQSIRSTEGAHIEGQYNVTGSPFAHIEGYGNGGIGEYMHVEGEQNIGLGSATHVEGNSNYVSATNTHAEGVFSFIDSGDYVHTQNGYHRIYGSSNSSASGYKTSIYSSNYAYIEGYGLSYAPGTNSMIVGSTRDDDSSLWNTHFTFLSNTGYLDYFGYKSSTQKCDLQSTIIGSDASHAEGYGVLIYGSNYAHIEGGSYKDTKGDILYRHSMDSSFYGHVEGAGNWLQYHSYGHVEGFKNYVTTGEQSHIEGTGHFLQNGPTCCHVEGNESFTTNSSKYIHIEGTNDISSDLNMSDLDMDTLNGYRASYIFKKTFASLPDAPAPYADYTPTAGNICVKMTILMSNGQYPIIAMPVQVSKSSDMTVDDALKAAHIAYDDISNYETTGSGSSKRITKLWGSNVTDLYLVDCFRDNGYFPNQRTAYINGILQNGDEIFVCCYNDTSGKTDKFTTLNASYSLDYNSNLNISVNASYQGTQYYTRWSNAYVYIDGKRASNNYWSSDTAKTDNYGMATVKYVRKTDDSGWENITYGPHVVTLVPSDGGYYFVWPVVVEPPTEVSTTYSHAVYNGKATHLEGHSNIIANDQVSHIEGNYNIVHETKNTHVEGAGNFGAGLRTCHIEGSSNFLGNGTVMATTYYFEYAHVEGKNNTLTASVHLAHIEGNSNTFDGVSSDKGTHVEGYSNAFSYGDTCHIEGEFNKVGYGAEGTHTEGYKNESVNGARYDHLEGTLNHIGEGSSFNHAEGQLHYINSGSTNHMEGQGYSIYGTSNFNHIEGIGDIDYIRDTLNLGDLITRVSPNTSNYTPYGETTTSTVCSISQGNMGSHIEGIGNTILNGMPAILTTMGGSGFHMEGVLNKASGGMTHVEGIGNISNSTSGGHIEGYLNTVSSGSSFTRNGQTIYCPGVHVEGLFHTLTLGLGAHVEGLGHTSTCVYGSHIEGEYNTIVGWTAQEGDTSTETISAQRSYSMNNHIEGYKNTGCGWVAHVQGIGNIANADAQTVLGKFNIKDTTATKANGFGTYAVIIGNGTSTEMEVYDNTETYAVDDEVVYQGVAYKCIVAVTEAEDFDSEKWDELDYEIIDDAKVTRSNAMTVSWGGVLNVIGAGADIQINGTSIASGGDIANPNISDAYSSTTYDVGDYCIYQNTLYKCNTAITVAEAWTAAHWTATTVGAELLAIINRVSALETALNGYSFSDN